MTLSRRKTLPSTELRILLQESDRECSLPPERKDPQPFLLHTSSMASRPSSGRRTLRSSVELNNGWFSENLGLNKGAKTGEARLGVLKDTRRDTISEGLEAIGYRHGDPRPWLKELLRTWHHQASLTSLEIWTDVKVMKVWRWDFGQWCDCD